MSCDESDSEEEILVYAEFEDSVNIDKYRSIHVLGVNEKNPIIQMDDSFFLGKHESALGTYMFFEEDPKPPVQDPLFDKMPERSLKYSYKTRKVINMERAYVSPIEGTGHDPQKLLQMEEDDVKPINFKNLHTALEKFRNDWNPHCLVEVKLNNKEDKKDTEEGGQRQINLDNSGSEKDIADIISSKGYLPVETDLPKAAFVKGTENDATLLLSKLSDEELVKLLNQQPNKNVFDINDILKIALGSNPVHSSDKPSSDIKNIRSPKIIQESSDIFEKSNRNPVSNNNKNMQSAVFRLENKKVDPYKTKKGSDLKYVAYQKLNNLLYSRPQESMNDDNDDEDNKKELLFDVLVAQLRTLCCKSSKHSKNSVSKMIQNDLIKNFLPHSDPATVNVEIKEHLFLIMNDDIKGNGNDELITVDPDSLQSNSSVLLLGPITSPLSDNQLKLVMSRISKELQKPEYVSLLQQLSVGTLNESNTRFMKSLITGPATRRYIKPHRCNYQSKLAKVYGGPRWIICTGYLNLNKPSLYD